MLVHSRRSPPEDNASQSSGTLALDNNEDDDDGRNLWDLRVKVTLHGGGRGGSSPRQSGVNGVGWSEQQQRRVGGGGAARGEAGGSERALV